MHASRLEQLEAFYREDPHDPFNLYALALEYMKVDPSKALLSLEKLRKEKREYLPTYYQLAKLYEADEAYDQAELIYREGLEVSDLQKDEHTFKELEKALQQMLLNKDLL